MAYDILITNAEILDGTGAPAMAGSVAVQDGKIVAIGDVSGGGTSRHRCPRTDVITGVH